MCIFNVRQIITRHFSGNDVDKSTAQNAHKHAISSENFFLGGGA